MIYEQLQSQRTELVTMNDRLLVMSTLVENNTNQIKYLWYVLATVGITVLAIILERVLL